MFTKPNLNQTDNYPPQVGRLIDLAEGPRRRNFVRNGDFQVAQHGNNFAGLTVTAQYTLDGVKYEGGAVCGTNTISQQAFAVGQVQVPGNPRFFIRNQRTVAGSAGNAVFTFPIAMPDRLSGKTVTVGFWAKADAPKAFILDVAYAGVTPGVYPGSLGAINLTAAWQYVKITFTLEAMTAVTAIAAASVRIVENAGFGTFTLDVADFQVELGLEGALFERLDFDQQLEWNQHFYCKSCAVATGPAANLGTGTGETVFGAGKAGAAAEVSPRIYFPVRMFGVPAITILNPNAANSQVRDQTAAADCSASAAANITDGGFHVTATGAAGTAVGNTLAFHWQASKEL
jgi:hypothetical protein